MQREELSSAAVLPEAEVLLATKLGVPARGTRYLARPRLRDLLEGTHEARLVLVSAPAGFGKSVLVADWLTRGGPRFAWLSLAPADNDPAPFLRYLRAAGASMRRGKEARPLASIAARPADQEIAIADLLSALVDRPDPAIIVLDDYHVVEASAIHAIVATLIDRLPPSARLVIVTRVDPPLPLARLRARGELLEIRADDLRFTAAEAAAFLAGPMALELAADLVDILVRRTEGWVAALQLAALSLRNRTDVARVVHEFGASNRFLLDFVLEEVLANQPEATTEFLLRTSILDRLTGSLCDRLTGRSDGAEVLERLARSNMLLFGVDQNRRWYRYHQLFAELLQARLAMREPDMSSGLREQAATWFEAHGLLDDAIEQALRATDWVRARRLVRRHWTAVMHAGELWTVQRWLDALPAEVVRGDPQLSATYAFGHVLRGETDGVEVRLDDARAALAGGVGVDPVDRALVPPQLKLIEAKLAELQGDPQVEIARGRAAIELIPEGVSPDVQALLRGDALNLIGQAHLLAGEDALAAEAFTEALPLLRRVGNAIAVAHGARDLVRIELRRGDARAALQLCESLLPADGDTEPAAAAALHLARAEALLVAGQPDLARAAALHAHDLAHDSGDGPVLRDCSRLLEKITRPESALRRGPGRAGPAPSWSSDLFEPLTPREAQVLQLVAAGRSNGQIATDLFVTVGTVKAHVHAICAKLGVGSRVQAIVRGRELGLLG
jgi:LuxR family maltose regulon positive regulatory protein